MVTGSDGREALGVTCYSTKGAEGLGGKFSTFNRFLYHTNNLMWTVHELGLFGYQCQMVCFTWIQLSHVTVFL